MSINKQLSAFYVKQGLTGKHLRSALKFDRRGVRKGIAGETAFWLYSDRPDCLFNAFGWASSPSIPGIKDQGLYWCRRDV